MATTTTATEQAMRLADAPKSSGQIAPAGRAANVKVTDVIISGRYHAHRPFAKVAARRRRPLAADPRRCYITAPSGE
jgi:hypothetical protein